eukprot:scaffold15944_cov108-Skeletonema_menzelii.AAC.1
MSAAGKDEDTMLFCASCGIAGGDDIKLKKCTACHLVKYCSVKCQKDHRPQHKRACKKRAAEIHDEILFKQPESNHLGDCPICCLPLPIDIEKSVLMTCCSKTICGGCNYANKKREHEGKLQHSCPFCRNAVPKTDEENYEQLMKRVEANDPLAMWEMGTERCEEGDYKKAFEYWSKAAALGDARGKGRVDRAVKHHIIAAKLGHDKSLEAVKDLYKAGQVSKEDFAAALRGHQAAVDATKSPQREAAVEYMKWRAERGRGVGGSALTRS